MSLLLFFLPTDFTNITKFVFCVILRILLFVYPYLVHLVHLVTIFKLSSCSSCSPLAPPHHVRCFTHPFCTFIGGKFDVLDWIAES